MCFPPGSAACSPEQLPAQTVYIGDFLYGLESGLQTGITVGSMLPSVLNISAEGHDSADRTVEAPTWWTARGGGGLWELSAIPGLICCAKVTFEQSSVVSMKLPSSPACADASQDTLQFGKRAASADVNVQKEACPGSLCQSTIRCTATGLSNKVCRQRV